MAVDVSREQVIAYRVAAHQFDRSTASVQDLAVLDIGVQDAAGEQARLAFDARLPAPPAADLIGPGQDLALVWSLRGAPYVHRRADLDSVAAALYPLSEADAAQRLNETGPSIQRRGMAALDQYATAVRAMRTVVRTPTAKGAASTAVTQAIPKAMWRECRACKTSHISDSAMRSACLPAGLELQPGTAPPVLQRRPRAKLPTKPDLGALTALARHYLALLGPATPAHVAGYVDGRRADVERAWPDELTEVRIGRSTAWLPADCVDALQSAPPPDLVRLLGGFDPYLQARDRDLIVPDQAVQKALWPVLGRPGAVFVDGEVAGTWRPKTAGTKLTVQVEAFAPLPPGVWTQIEAEAERVAAVRGLRLGGVRRSA
jgi:Winged helix DNA-binding domain